MSLKAVAQETLSIVQAGKLTTASDLSVDFLKWWQMLLVSG